MSVEFSAFYDLMLPELPGCTPELLDLQLREVAREFCRRTSAWRVTFDPIGLKEGVRTYDVYAPENGAELVRITKLVISEELLWEDSAREDDGRAKYPRGQAPFKVADDLKSLTLISELTPEATIPQALKLDGALQPKTDAKKLPTILRSQHSEAMRYGTLGRLMAMGKKPWTDRDMARFYIGEWHMALNFAAHQAQTGNTREPLRSRLRTV